MSRRQHTVYQIPVRLARGELKIFSFSPRRRVGRVGNVWDEVCLRLAVLSAPMFGTGKQEGRRFPAVPRSLAVALLVMPLPFP